MIPESSEVMADWRECDVDAGGVNIHVHRVAQAFEDDFDIVMVDARNHGKSGTAGGDGAPPTADVAAVVAQLGLERPTLIGHSVGARTVADFAATQPGVVARLVLIDPPWKASQEADGGASDSRREAMRSWLVSCSEATTIELEARACEQHSTWPPEEYPTWIESKQQVRPEAADTVARSGWGETVIAIDCPTLLIHGDPNIGGIVTDDVARRAAELNSTTSTASSSNGSST